MGAISRTCEESVPLYISVSEGRNVNLNSPTAPFLLSQSISDLQQASGMFNECPPQTGDAMSYQTETASRIAFDFTEIL